MAERQFPVDFVVVAASVAGLRQVARLLEVVDDVRRRSFSNPHADGDVSEPRAGIGGDDVPAPQAARMAATQRPATQEALTASSGERPLWRELPSWFVIAEEDRNIPAELQRFMAERAGARRTLEIPGASHAVTVAARGDR
jgi:pimeloyl-ACP methyl ester carboxylesterase